MVLLLWLNGFMILWFYGSMVSYNAKNTTHHLLHYLPFTTYYLPLNYLPIYYLLPTATAHCLLQFKNTPASSCLPLRYRIVCHLPGYHVPSAGRQQPPAQFFPVYLHLILYLL